MKDRNRLYIGENDKEDSFVGDLHFRTFAQGSKHQSKQPFLLHGKELILLFLENDNPFTNSGLIAFDGKKVQIDGKWKNNRFIVQKISVQDT